MSSFNIQLEDHMVHSPVDAAPGVSDAAPVLQSKVEPGVAEPPSDDKFAVAEDLVDAARVADSTRSSYTSRLITADIPKITGIPPDILYSGQSILILAELRLSTKS